MKFNPVIIFLFLCALVACNQNDSAQLVESKKADAESVRPDTTAFTITSSATGWFEFHQLTDKDQIYKALTLPLELKHTPFDSTDFIPHFPLNTKDPVFQKFQSFFRYSPDSTYAIDLDSYSLHLEKDKNGNWISSGSEMDRKVFLLNLKTHQKSELLFCGSDCIPEEAEWISDTEVRIYGLTMREGVFHPVQWVFYLNEFPTTIAWVYFKETLAKPGDYISKIRLRDVTFL